MSAPPPRATSVAIHKVRVNCIVGKNRSSTQVLSGALAAAAVVGSVLLANVVATASPATGLVIGTDSIVPAEGSDAVAMSVTTSGACPSQAVGADAFITGPVGAVDPSKETFPPDNPYPIVTNNHVQFSTSAAFSQQFKLLLKDAAAQRGMVIQPGRYDVQTRCIDRLGTTVFGIFTAAINFDTPTHYTAIAAPVTTTTAPVTTTTASTSPEPTSPEPTSPEPTPSSTTTTSNTPTPSETTDSSTSATTTSEGAIATPATSASPPADSSDGTTLATGGSLARTGSPIDLIFLAGLILLVVGLALLLCLQRRSAAE